MYQDVSGGLAAVVVLEMPFEVITEAVNALAHAVNALALLRRHRMEFHDNTSFRPGLRIMPASLT